MPKIVEGRDGSDANVSFTIYVYWAYLATLIKQSTMKRSVGPFFSLLLISVFAVTLSCRALIRHGGFHFSSFDLETNEIAPQPLAPDFNSTLLEYAAVDISEPNTKKEIEELLDINLASQRESRPFATWQRSHITRASSSRVILALLRSPELHKRWLDFRKLLQDWLRNKRHQPEVMNELVDLVKKPIDKNNGVMGLNGRYNSCAVVGNSGILLQREYGELIDGHEAVIRLNNARIQKFERNVGVKTTISFVNSNVFHLCARRPGCFCHSYGANVPIVMYICQPVHFLDYTICNTSQKAPLIVTDPRFDVLCARIVKYYSLKQFAEETGKSLDEWSSAHDGSMFHYSSGFQAVMLAVGMCDKVSIFGFGKSASAKHHYHTNQKEELKLHDYEAEYNIYHDLVNNPQLIPFISDKFKFPPVVIYQ